MANKSIEIKIPEEQDVELLAELAQVTFKESHGHSAADADIQTYLTKNYTIERLKADILHSKNSYHTIYFQNELAGFSKIVMNEGHPEIALKNITKLERLYVLEKFHGKGLGLDLFTFNIDLCKQHQQGGVWLYTWTGNHRAIAFYKKMGFEIIGFHDFKISKNHSNPNHLMFLEIRD